MAGLKEHIFLIGFMGCGKSTKRSVPGGDDRGGAGGDGSGDRERGTDGDRGDL